MFTTALLSIYPQYILFHTAGNPSAADLFFGLLAVYGYLRWRSHETIRWLAVTSLCAGAATFSHFYAGVVAIGLLAHYTLTTSHDLPTQLRTVVAYGIGLLPAAFLLVTYKLIFAPADPSSHYFDRLLINSFDTVYASQQVFDIGFPVYSNKMILEFFLQHKGKSPIFGWYWMVALAGAVLAFGTHHRKSATGAATLVWTWVMAGLLIVILIPGGVIYHDYYTWWLLLGVFTGIALTIDTLTESIVTDRDMITMTQLLLTELFIIFILWLSLTSTWTNLLS